jgi:hypothetical protein
MVGLEGLVTNAISINTPLNSNNNLGLGISLVNDKIGPTVENVPIKADLSYTIPTSSTYKFLFGMKATANLFSLDPSKLNPADSDPLFVITHKFLSQYWCWCLLAF